MNSFLIADSKIFGGSLSTRVSSAHKHFPFLRGGVWAEAQVQGSAVRRSNSARWPVVRSKPQNDCGEQGHQGGSPRATVLDQRAARTTSTRSDGDGDDIVPNFRRHLHRSVARRLKDGEKGGSRSPVDLAAVLPSRLKLARWRKRCLTRRRHHPGQTARVRSRWREKPRQPPGPALLDLASLVRGLSVELERPFARWRRRQCSRRTTHQTGGNQPGPSSQRFDRGSKVVHRVSADRPLHRYASVGVPKRTNQFRGAGYDIGATTIGL